MATLNPWSDLSQMGFFANHSFTTCHFRILWHCTNCTEGRSCVSTDIVDVQILRRQFNFLKNPEYKILYIYIYTGLSSGLLLLQILSIHIFVFVCVTFFFFNQLRILAIKTQLSCFKPCLNAVFVYQPHTTGTVSTLWGV